MSRTLCQVVSLWVLLCLLGCGYQLRGQVPGLASDKRLWVAGNDLALVNALKKAVLESEATLLTELESKESANSIVLLGESSTSQSPTAYNSEGDIIEYGINYLIRFTVNGRSHQFSTTVSYDYNKTQLLSSEQNKNIALQEITDLAVVFILRQLQ